MAEKTAHLDLNIPGGNEFPDNEPLAENFEKLDTEVFRRGKSFNGTEVNANGDFVVEEVPYARNIATDEQKHSSGEYIVRTTGGTEGVIDGEANLIGIHGRCNHTGKTEKILEIVVNAPRAEGEDPLVAELDEETFLAYVGDPASIMVELNYTDAWSANPSLYGVTVTGTPKNGDSIVINYVRADRGTITPASPTAFRSTGWNLYNHELGYAIGVKYSNEYGFIVGGTYTSLQYSETIDGVKTGISVESSRFTIPGNGYIWVTGGNDTDTYILMTRSDWTTGPDDGWKVYEESEIDLSGAMQNFPYGLCRVGPIVDEINIGGKVAIRRIGRDAWSEQGEAALITAGTEYDADRDYIYYVLDKPVETALTISDEYTANDHGLEIIDSTTSTAPFVQTMYGENLVDKLRRKVVAVTEQSFQQSEQETARQNIGAAADSEVIKTVNGRHPDVNGNITVIEGGGSSSYGSYRLDVTIPASAWSGSGPYTATVTNSLIKSTMDGGETWLDDESAMLGATDFTTVDGALQISTTVKPTATWSLHVALAVNGAAVLADVSALQDTVSGHSTELTNIKNSMYVVANGNRTTVAVAVGQYVLLQNSTITGLTDGLYVAAKTIPANVTIDSTYLTAATVSGNALGGLNHLKASVDSLNSKISNVVALFANSDLNNYLTPGKYGCGTNAAAATIVNSPVSVAFYLDVFKLQNVETGAWVNLIQRVTTYDGSEIYFRRCNTDGNGTWLFSAWVKYEPFDGKLILETVGLQNVNIDSLRGNTIGWVQSANASGTQPGFLYYTLLTFANGNGQVVQIAIPMASSPIKSRTYANGSWAEWA